MGVNRKEKSEVSGCYRGLFKILLPPRWVSWDPNLGFLIHMSKVLRGLTLLMAIQASLGCPFLLFFLHSKHFLLIRHWQSVVLGTRGKGCVNYCSCLSGAQVGYAGRQTMTISYDRILLRYVQRAVGEGKKRGIKCITVLQRLCRWKGYLIT